MSGSVRKSNSTNDNSSVQELVAKFAADEKALALSSEASLQQLHILQQTHHSMSSVHDKQSSDPTLILDDECLLQVFSLLGDHRRAFGLALVGPQWRKVVYNILPKLAGPLQVELLGIDQKEKDLCVSWMSRRNFPIGGIIYGGDSGDHAQCSFQLLLSRYDRSIERVRPEECPRLSHVSVFMEKGVADVLNGSNIFASSLFVLPSIQVLELKLSRDHAALDGSFFLQLIKNLPNLQKLRLASGKDTLGQQQVYHVRSESLKELDVSNLTRGAILSLDCPNLISFQVGGTISRSRPHAGFRMFKQKLEAAKLPRSCSFQVLQKGEPQVTNVSLWELTNNPRSTEHEIWRAALSSL